MRDIIIALSAILVLKLLPQKKDFMLTCEEMSLRAPKGHYEDLCEYGTGGSKFDDPSFWIASDGVHGLRDRMAVSYFYLRLVQNHRKLRTIDLSDSYDIWSKLIRQLFYSILALPEAALGHLYHTHYRAARKSVALYCELLIRANTLCFSASNRLCPINTPELL
jgi:hypothetical protein